MSEVAWMFVSFFLCSLALPSSGTLVGFSYNARRSSVSSSPIETISFLKENKVSPSQIRVCVSNHSGLNTLSDSGVHVDLYLNESDIESMRKSKASVISQNITSVIVDSSNSDLVAQKQLSSLLASLETIRSVLKSSDLNRDVKVAVAFPLAVLEKLERQQANDLLRIVNFIKKYKSFVVLETEINGELSMGDRFVESMIKSAASAANVLKDRDVNVILNVKSTVAASAIEVAEFSKKMRKSTSSYAHISDRISGIFAEIRPMEESKQKELTREEEMIFHPSRRKLNSVPISTTQITRHDTVIPTPTIVTVPSTNPVAITPTNPVGNPVTVPSTNPVVTTPINPVTPPSAVPSGNTPTNPVTAIPPPATTPTNPGTSPSTGGGQTWCVAKSGAPASALQTALDYACGMGGADCSTIQQSGSCYNPNTLQNHASYAFNSYYQKNPSPTSCDFKGAAQLTTINPSTGSCVYPSSSGGGGTSTPPTTTTPPGATTPPGGATTPPGGATTPPGGTTTPPGGATTPPGGATTPPGGTTTPPGGTTTPPGGATTPPGGATTPPSTTTPTPFPDTSNGAPNFNSPPGFGTSPPPGFSTSESISTGLQPLCASTILALFLVTGRLLMDIGFHF